MITVKDFNIPFSTINNPYTTNKKIVDLKNTKDQMYLTDIHRIFHPMAVECTFFSSAHGMFSRIHHTLDHKRSLNKFKKTETLHQYFF